MLGGTERGPRGIYAADLTERQLIEPQVVESLERVRHRRPATVERVSHERARRIRRVEVDDPGGVRKTVDG